VRPSLGWIAAGAGVAYAVLVRPHLLSWGATRAESAGVLPGDDLVRARWQSTRAVTIAAPAADVWPWLVQMGFGRAGWYSYDWVERVIGAGDFAEGGSARSVLPQFQQLAIGDSVPLSAEGGLTAAVVDPSRALVLRMAMNVLSSAPARDGDRVVLNWTWAFVLIPVGASSCRLLARVRADYRPRAIGLLLPTLLEPVHLLMERAMLRGIRWRAEGRARGTLSEQGGLRGDRSAAGRFRAHLLNPVLRVLLRSPAHQLLSGSVLLLEYSGRRSGRRYGLPVMYAATGDGFVVMAGQPAGKTWWRNFSGEPRPVVATVCRKQEPGSARLLDAGSDEHRQAVQVYQRRFPKLVLDPTAPVLLLTGPVGGDTLTSTDS
jgi:hypothetical protein